MKKFTFIISFLLVALQQLSGQTIPKFSYQAVLRNADGSVVSNQTVDIKISLHEASISGTVVYSEVQSYNINNGQGIISLAIGGGVVQSGSFATIPWSVDIFLQVEVKKAGESSYTSMGTSQILAVPYALYAGSVKEVKSPPTANADDPIFEVKNKDGKVVFGVYQGGVRIYVEDSPTIKGSKGGFAVGGLTNQGKSGIPYEYFRITSDSSRIYINDLPGKGSKGGFAVGGLTNQGKSSDNGDYFKVTKDTSYFSTTLYTESNIISTGNITSGAGTVSDSLVKDKDNHTYHTVKIGTQVWFKENLKTTRYSDSTQLSSMDAQAYNNSFNTDTINNYGLLYGYNAINSSLNVCPTGWHVPTELDWQVLMGFVGGPEWINNPITTGLKLMETGTGFWYNSNLQANNVTGFSARPGGEANPSTQWIFNGIGMEATWAIDQFSSNVVKLDGNTGSVSITAGSGGAYSVRCIKGAPIPFKKK